MLAPSKLDVLRRHSVIDFDGLDVEVAQKLGPFVNCTSNQAITYFEALKPSNHHLIVQAAEQAIKLEADETKRVAVGVKILMILQSLRILPHITGAVLTQSSMREAHSVDGTIEDARRIISLYAALSPDTPKSRICIKIPSTWEGLKAAHVLETEYDIRTLGTTLFTLEQAVLASEQSTTYISPYINELKVHFVEGYKDDNAGFGVVRDIWNYYRSVKPARKTQIMAASLTSTDEVLSLGGLPHLTISASLLTSLSATAAEEYDVPYKQNAEIRAPPNSNDLAGLSQDETRYRALFRANNEAVRKLDEAITTFLTFEERMEELIRKELEVIAQATI